MAVATTTLMRTITSVTVIATTVTAPPNVNTSTIDLSPVTVTNSVDEEPVANPSQDSAISSITIVNSTSSLASQASSAAPSFPPPDVPVPNPSSASTPVETSSTPTTSTSTSTPSSSISSVTSDLALNTPVFDKQPDSTPIPAQDSPLFDVEPTSTASSTGPATPVFDESPISSTSSSALNTPEFIKQPTETQLESDNVQSVTTVQSISSQETSQQTTSESIRSTQDSSPQTTERHTSHTIEKAILQPVPTSGTAQATSSSFSTSSSSSSTSSVPSTTLQTGATSTAASVPESTESSDDSTTRQADSGITNPQATFTTATLPGGRLTTIALDPTAASDTSSPSDTAVGVVGSEVANSPSTPVVVGGIVGSLAALSFFFVLIFLLRRRMAKRRRSTLLTPLSLAPGAPSSGASSEKQKHYEIDTASLGPTPRSTKLAAALAFYPKRVGKKLRLSQMPANNQNHNVNMNRGNSQFLDPAGTHSRRGSVNSTDGNRLQGWWSRIIQDTNSDDLLAQDMAEKANYPGPAYFPSTDASRLDRESQLRRMSRARSVDSWTDRAASPNPFSDLNTIGESSTKQELRNPFADSNSLIPPPLAKVTPAPGGYAREVQRSRGQSMSYGANPRRARPDSFDVVSFYRDSTATNSSFYARRNKTHSNPFDLEMDGPLPPTEADMRPPRRPVASSIYDAPRPASARTRGDSFTSRYTSGVGGYQAEWTTMNPHSSRWDSTVGYVPTGHVRSESDGRVLRSSGVGQAM